MTRLWQYVCAATLVLAVNAHATNAPWTFRGAIRFALTNSPDARIAQQRIVAAQAGIDQANAAMWPVIQLQSSYTRTDNPMMVFGSILAQRAYNYSAPPDFNSLPDLDDLNVKSLVSMPLYAGGRIRAGREGAHAMAAASRHEAQAVRNDIAFEVARAFQTVLKTRAFIQATTAAVQSYETNLVLAKKRFAAGTLLKADVLDVQVRLAQARDDAVRAQNANALAVRALRTLLGVSDPDFQVANTAPDVPPPKTGDYLQRPELLAMQQRERAAATAVRGAKAGYRPKLSAFASLDYDYGFRTEGDGKSYTAGAVVQWNLWDGKLTRAKVAEARAKQQAAAQQTRKLRLALSLQVEQAQLRLNAADQRLAVTDQEVAQATESLQLTQARFGEGLALGTQLFDAETALTAARVRHAQAEADRHIAIAALRLALGLPQFDPQTAHH